MSNDRDLKIAARERLFDAILREAAPAELAGHPGPAAEPRFAVGAEPAPDRPRATAISVAIAAIVVVAAVMFATRSSSRTASLQQSTPPLVEALGPAELASLPADTPALRVYGLRDGDVPSLARFTALRHLEVGGPAPGLDGGGGLTDSGIADIAELSTLRELHLDNAYQPSDAGWSKLADLPMLEVLSAANTNIGDTTLVALGARGRLNAVVLRSCGSFSGVGLRALARLELRTLDLSGCSQLRGEDLACLTTMTGLRHLLLGSCDGVDDTVLGSLHALHQLELLSLAHCAAGDRGLLALRDLPLLAELSLSGCTAITDAAAGNLPHCLQKLSCGDCPQLTDAFLVGLSKLPALRHLSLHKPYRQQTEPTAFTGGGIAALLRSAQLEELDLSGNQRLQEVGWSELWAAVSADQQLIELAVRGLRRVDDSCCRDLSAHPRLERLQLGATSVSDEGLGILAAAEGRWVELDLSYLDGISMAGVATLAGQPLQRLSLFGMRADPEVVAGRKAELWPQARVCLPDGRSMR